MEKALFAAGCFWGVEDRFQKLPGVLDVVSGYAGGTVENPSYEAVCGGSTGHAETVEVTFDPERISYEDLLNEFWKLHDPTDIGGQGVDRGNQYRSAIFYLSEDQKEKAEKSKKDLQKSKKFIKPIATEITVAGPFYKAEEYHQDYIKKSGGGACHF